MREGRFDAAFLAVGAHIAKRAYIPAGEAAHMLDAVSVLRGMEGEDKPMLGRRVVVYGGGNTALDVARTAKRLGATESIIVYRRTREKMPAHDFEVEEALQEGVLIKWLSTIKNMADEGTLTVEKMALDAKGFPQPTGEFETLEADSLVLALGQDVDLSLLDGVPGLAIKDGTVEVGPNMMTGHPGHLRRRRHGAVRAHGDRGHRPRQEGRAPHRRVARPARRTRPPPKHEVATFDKLNPWYYSDAPKTVRPMLDVARRTSTFDEVVAGLDEIERPVRGAPVPVLRQLLRVRQLLRRVPRQRGDQARAGQALRVQLRLLQGLRHLRRPNARAVRSRWCRRRTESLARR